MPVVKLAIVTGSRDCFPIELAVKRTQALKAACEALGIEAYFCEQVIQTETDAMMALAMCEEAKANAACVYLGNFGPEGPMTIFAKKFNEKFGPVMFCGAAEESGQNLHDGRGDAMCGMLSAKLNAMLRKVKCYLPRKPIGLPAELAQEISHFYKVARVALGLRSLKVITFGPRPQDFFACNAPIEQLLDMGIEVMENSELDLYRAFEAVEVNDSDVLATIAEMEAELGEGNTYPDLLPKLARFEVCLTRFVMGNKGASQFVILTSKCWPAFEAQFGFVPCCINGRMAAKGIPAACEVDVYGATSEYICMLAADDVPMLWDINNTVPADLLTPDLQKLLADLFMGFHCGNTSACNLCAGRAMKKQDIMYRLMEPGKEPNITRGTLEGTFKPGALTMFRFQPRIGGGLMSYVAQGQVLDVDPQSFGGIGVVHIPGFARFYRYAMLENGFPHHGAFVYGHVAVVIYDAMQLIGVSDISFPLPATTRYPTENPFELPVVMALNPPS